MTRFIYITLFTLLDFIMTPTDTYDCVKKSDNIENTCTKQTDTEKEKKGCCDSEKGQCGKHCDGKCGNPACYCPTNCTSFTIPFFAQLKQVKVIAGKPNFYYQETYYSLGILSIWLPPKIC